MKDVVTFITRLRRLVLWAGLLACAGCGWFSSPALPSETSPGTNETPAGKTPAAGLDELPAGLLAILTETPTPAACAFVWDIKPQPEITQQVQAALDRAGMTGVKITVESYGETCFNTAKKTVSDFKILQTNFRASAGGYSLKNRESAGDLAAGIVKTLLIFPGGTFPGTQPGTVTLELLQGTGTETMQFPLDKATELVEKGIHGAALLESLG